MSAGPVVDTSATRSAPLRSADPRGADQRGRDHEPRVALALGLVALLMAVASVMPELARSTWVFRDGRFYVNVATTITESLSLDQHRFAASWYSGTLGWNRDLDPGWSNVALGAHGEHFPKHPYVLPMLASPFVFAAGLPATLAWNLVMFGVIAAGLYRFARDYVDASSAVGTVALFLFGTVILGSAYDFSTDVLMLALFALGLASVLEGRGASAGVCVALCVIIKPTALMLGPSLVMLVLERGDRRTLWRSLIAGTIVLLAFAAANTWMYGRPWWSGYNRTLVTVAGEPTVASHTDAFSVPFDEGLRRVLWGDYGLVAAFTVLALAAPGLIALLYRRPLPALGGALAAALSLVVFARYTYEGHRFHWPALALLVPALATSVHGAARGVATLTRRFTARRGHDARGDLSPIAAAIAVGAACLAALPWGSPAARVGGGAWGDATLGTLESLGMGTTGAAVLVALVNILIAGLFAAGCVRLVSGVAASPVAVAAVVLPAMLPVVRDSLLAGGPLVIAMALGTWGADRLLARRWVTAGVLCLLAVIAHFSLPDRAPIAVGERGLIEVAVAAIGARAPARLMVPIALGAIAALPFAWRRSPRVGAAMLVLALLACVPGVAVRGLRFEASVAPLVAMPLAALADVLGTWLSAAWRAATPQRTAMTIGAVLACCLLIGLARRSAHASAPFAVHAPESVAHARVLHGHARYGDVPCDFLAWEHLSWECSHLDSGLYGMVGLATSGGGVWVSGRTLPMLVLPTGMRGETRRVIWDDVRAGRALHLRWAIPDDLAGDATLRVLVDDREVGAIEIPPAPDGALHDWVIETPDAGARTTLELRIEAHQRYRQAVVGVDGEWR